MPMMNTLRAPRFAAEGFAPELTHHIFLVAIRGEPPSPVRHPGGALHPMQVILMGPGDLPALAGIEAAIGPLPALPSPQRLMRAARSASLVPREVKGEILRDGRGRLYEMVGDHVRPINHLYSGARGEMIDVAPLRDVTPGSGDDDFPGEDDDRAPGPDGAEAPRAGEETSHRPFREIARRLVPEPGLWRLVRYADFVDALLPQLANPARLQPGHQLPCYAQIHELAVSLPMAALEESAAGELGHSGKLLPLSYDLCRRFALSLPRPAFGLAATRHPAGPGIVPAGARFITLRVALDPTANVPVTAPQAAGTVTPAPSASSSKTAIPEEFCKPWDLRMSRDEAIYDMTLAGSRSAWQRLVERLTRHISSGAMKKWHALLVGKSADEQLWGIQPPRGALGDARIRRWVEQILQLGGYDVPRMLVEWEIHWRRKSPRDS